MPESAEAHLAALPTSRRAATPGHQPLVLPSGLERMLATTPAKLSTAPALVLPGSPRKAETKPAAAEALAAPAAGRGPTSAGKRAARLAELAAQSPKNCSAKVNSNSAVLRQHLEEEAAPKAFQLIEN